MLSNGLLHPGKGLDLVLKALPDVVAQYPSLLYIILGKPHPACGTTCVNHHNWLKEFVAHSNLTANVHFMEQYSSDKEMKRILLASDIYVAAYRDRITSNSGTLSMAMAAGKLVIATPFEHAKYVLSSRGLLVPFEDPAGVRAALLEGLSDPARTKQMAAAARKFARDLEWEAVARQYKALFYELAAGNASHARHSRKHATGKTSSRWTGWRQ